MRLLHADFGKAGASRFGRSITGERFSVAAFPLQRIAPVEQSQDIIRRKGEDGVVASQRFGRPVHLHQQVAQTDPARMAVRIEFDGMAIAGFRFTMTPHPLQQRGTFAAR